MKLLRFTVVGLLACVSFVSCCLVKFEAEPFGLDPLTKPLYTGESVKEFLKLCGGKGFKTSDKALEKLRIKALNKTEKNKDSDCKVLDKKANKTSVLSNLQMYYMKNAQSRVSLQQEYFKSDWKGPVRLIMFLVPLGITVFLVMAGHFDYKTLPFLGNTLFQSDATDGIKYQQYQWMRYLVLPGNHSVFKGTERNLSDNSWVRYSKKDDAFSWKAVKFGRFKFCKHNQISKNIEDDEAHAKRINIWKSGWDFDFGLQEQKPHHFQSRQ